MICFIIFWTVVVIKVFLPSEPLYPDFILVNSTTSPGEEKKLKLV